MSRYQPLLSRWLVFFTLARNELAPTAINSKLELHVVDFIRQAVDAVWETGGVDCDVAIDTASLFRPAVVDYDAK
jgi:hypothetical protein